MSERFFIETYGIWDNEKGNEKLTWEELCNVLNELNNENKQLKQRINNLGEKQISQREMEIKSIIRNQVKIAGKNTRKSGGIVMFFIEDIVDGVYSGLNEKGYFKENDKRDIDD